MATTTPNLGLTLPGLDDQADIAVLNGNFTKIDTEAGAVDSSLGKMAQFSQMFFNSSNPVHISFSAYACCAHIFGGSATNRFIEIFFANGYISVNDNSGGLISYTFDQSTYKDFAFTTSSTANGYIGVIAPSNVTITMDRNV